MSTIKQAVENLFDPFVKDLEWITNIDSVTGNIEGSRRISVWLKGKIEALGGSYELRDNGTGAHVIARFKGTGKKKVLLVVHTDTVMGTEGGKRLFRMDENKLAYGAGVGDCKASAIQMLYLVKAMRDLNIAPYSELIVYFDAEEETSSKDEVAFASELAKESDYAIICDTGRPGWGICTRRKAVARYTIETHGLSGHAGNAPHATANAVAELGYIMVQIHKLGDWLGDPADYEQSNMKARGIVDRGQFIPENVVNIAHVSTNNDKFNIVPDYGMMKVEIRCYQLKEQERIDKEVRNICANPTIAGVTVKLSGGIDTPPMEKTPEAAKLADVYKKVVKEEYGAEVAEWTAGGLTIGNTTSRFVPTIDALGVDVDPLHEHTLREYTDLNTFAPRTVALIRMIQEVDSV